MSNTGFHHHAGPHLDDARFRRSHDAGALGEAIVRTLMAGYTGPVAIRLWDGRFASGAADAPVQLVFREPRALRELILSGGNLLRLGEAYLSGAIDVEGDMERVFGLADHLQAHQPDLRHRLALLYQALRLPSGRHASQGGEQRLSRRRVRRNGREAIAHHYDVGNEFYRLWLDPEMVYSCAYFRDDDQSLAGAQRDKLDYLCRKLRLRPGQSLLDIGCGWGALVLWAARRYGVRAHGITLSEAQYRHARERIRAEGLQDRVTVELRDYRDLADEARYDRVVSVGMFEHIGVTNFPAYFGTIRRVLRPGGLFLNHGITSDSGWRRTPLTRFVNRYVFPDGELARVSDVGDAMERAGFELLDVESLRRHYARTLRHWVQALEAAREQAVAVSSEAVWRLWRLYMAGSAWYFEQGSINVYQILAGHSGHTPPVPLRRDDLYLAHGGEFGTTATRTGEHA